MTGPYDRTAGTTNMTAALANAGETGAALAAVSNITAARYRSVTLGQIAIALAKKG